MTIANDNDYDHFNLDEKVIVIVNGRSFEKIFKIIKTNNISDNKRQQTTTVDNKRLFNGFVLTDGFSLQRENEIDMTDKKAFDKEHQSKIPFEELVNLINQKCDYKFAIIDNEVDEELMAMARKEGIDLSGYKHVIETSGVRHSESRHGNKSNDRNPLTIEDYLLIPYIIKYRDKVEFSNKKTKLHGLKTIVYRKTVGNLYVYVEEIRIGRNKSLAFQTLYKRTIRKASRQKEA